MSRHDHTAPGNSSGGYQGHAQTGDRLVRAYLEIVRSETPSMAGAALSGVLGAAMRFQMQDMKKPSAAGAIALLLPILQGVGAQIERVLASVPAEVEPQPAGASREPAQLSEATWTRVQDELAKLPVLTLLMPIDGRAVLISADLMGDLAQSFASVVDAEMLKRRPRLVVTNHVERALKAWNQESAT